MSTAKVLPAKKVRETKTKIHKPGAESRSTAPKGGVIRSTGAKAVAKALRVANPASIEAPLAISASSLLRLRTVNATSARQGLFRLMDETAEAHTPVLVTGRRTNSVLLSEADFMSIQETLFLVSIPGLREAILAGAKEPAASMAKRKDLKW